jgi:tyrosine-protein kinase Etk/Wzc
MPSLPVNYAKTRADQPYHEDNDEGIDFGDLIGILVSSKWLIISIASATLALGVAKTFLDKPVYKADGLLQIKEHSQPLAALGPLAGQLDTKLPTLAEVGLIKSRMILGKAINNLNLEVVATPRYMPVFGEAIARRFQEDGVAEPLFGQSGYAWGGEAIQVDTFTVSPGLDDKEFLLEAGTDGQFKLINNGEIILKGEVGTLGSTKVGNNSQSVSIFVSLLKSRPGTYFTVMRQSRNQAISQLNNNISVTEQGKGTGLLELTVESHSPDLAVRILNEIANIYVQQNVDQKSAESQKTLEFLEKQLPVLKEQMEAATTALNEYRIREGSIDLKLETQNILNGAVDLKTQITLLQQKRDELRQKYTESHPTIVSTDKQIARLHEQTISYDRKIKVLPDTQQAILRLSRDVEVNTELYATLLNNAQTLRLAKAGTVGNVRVVDYAIPPDAPIKPRKILIMGVALVLGLILAVAALLVRRLLKRGIDDPNLIEQQLNIPVYATIPHSKYQKVLENKLKSDSSLNKKLPVTLALEKKGDIAIESLRSLRTTLHFAFLEATNNIVLIAGPSPNVGKTFVATNLAIIMTDAGKKVLLIDGDMRKGSMSQMLATPREHGLSELISGAIKTDDAIHKIPGTDIDFIPTGAIPPNPSELLLHERFRIFLENIHKRYDLVIIDSPPVLAVTDATIISRHASATILVVRAGEHPIRELDQSARRLIQAGANLKGVVLNGLQPLSGGRGYGYGTDVYQYSYQDNKKIGLISRGLLASSKVNPWKTKPH